MVGEATGAAAAALPAAPPPQHQLGYTGLVDPILRVFVRPQRQQLGHDEIVHGLGRDQQRGAAVVPGVASTNLWHTWSLSRWPMSRLARLGSAPAASRWEAMAWCRARTATCSAVSLSWLQYRSRSTGFTQLSPARSTSSPVCCTSTKSDLQIKIVKRRNRKIQKIM